jgi:hypothetical protein
MKTTSTPALIRKLRNAYTVCNDCGEKYGTDRGGCSTYYVGICDVCNLETIVTESRDWCYLARGVRELQQSDKTLITENNNA